jgi:hypothetical protein
MKGIASGWKEHPALRNDTSFYYLSSSFVKILENIDAPGCSGCPWKGAIMSMPDLGEYSRFQRKAIQKG